MVYNPGSWTNNIPRTGTGEPYHTNNPVTLEAYWQGHEAGPNEITEAIHAADIAGVTWRHTPLAARETLLHAYATLLEKNSSQMANTIAFETGKPFWEANTEVQAMIQKIPISITAYHDRCPHRILTHGNKEIHVKHHPHGVMAVLGPFNFPGHLPNGHIVPALLAGNTIVFKPSEHTPQTGLLMAKLWEEAGLPKGALNVVFGGKTVGSYLVADPAIAGVCFTGSASAGIAISRAIADTPWKILALEMGGNNPLVLLDWDNSDAVSDLILLSAFQTSGQRCTCARRLLVLDTPQNRALVAQLPKRIKTLRYGAPHDTPPPFMGPVISAQAARQIYTHYERLCNKGAQILSPMTDPGTHAFLRPGLLDTTGMTLSDDEYFGPLLTLQWVQNEDAAYALAGQTRYGLSAGLVAKDPEAFVRFTNQVRAGIYTHNAPTTGASSATPFGGIGMSGNHRPSAYYAADYCAYPTTWSLKTTVGPEAVLDNFR